MFGQILDAIKTAIEAAFFWAYDLISSIGAFAFVSFFIFISIFVARVLPMAISRAGKSDTIKNSRGSKND